MCSRSPLRRTTVKTVTALAALAVGSVVCLHAQGAPVSTAEYRQLVERLAERWRRLTSEDSLVQAGPTGAEGPRLDSLRFGTLTLVVPPPRAAVAAAVGRAAWDSVTADFGADTLSLLPQTIALGRGRDRPGDWLPDPAASREYQESYGLSTVLAAVRDAETKRLEADGTSGAWLAASLAAMLYASDSIQRAATYMELATSPWAVVRACFDGDLGACHRALSLPSAPDSLVSLFTPAERRRLVEQSARSWTDLQRAPGTVRCIEAAVDSACVELFRRFPHSLHEIPLSPGARATLLRTAADLGGGGWYGRLLSSSSPDFLQRLAVAAGVTPDVLLTRWHARIMRAKPNPMTLSRLAGWTAFLWAAAFAVMATRSSRWRRD